MDGAPGQPGRRPVTRPIVPPIMPRPVYAVLVYARRAYARNRLFAGVATHGPVITMSLAGATALALAPSARSGEGFAALFLAAISAIAVGVVLACRHVLKDRAARYALAGAITLGAVAVGILVLARYAQEKIMALMMLADGIAIADGVFAAILFIWALWPPVPHLHRWRV